MAAGTAAVFAWKGETLEEYWNCTMGALFWPEDEGKESRGPDMIVDDGGDMTLIVHEGVKAEAAFKKDGSLPDPSSTDNEELKIVFKQLKDQLGKDSNHWTVAAERLQVHTQSPFLRRFVTRRRRCVCLGNLLLSLPPLMCER